MSELENQISAIPDLSEKPARRGRDKPFTVVLMTIYSIENAGIRYISAALQREGFETHIVFLRDWVHNRLEMPSDKEFQIDGRTFHKPFFKTPTQRAVVHALIPDSPAAIEEDQVRLMTIRSEGQFNTVVYEEHDFYRGQDRRDIIMMNEQDLRRMNIQEDDRIMVSTDTGRMEVVARVFDLPPGNAAMYYPEANLLVPRRVDPASRTPSFKCIVATISKM